ncbi:hypothetical protein ID47_09895 [Candidatus Paracaedibacter acanthamoebae]|uniref:DUF3576 domain-containing protein n=1 Tax=Candidatus Odyssella acanthamoebae TaxID=91604 RepID=A0A077AZ96_9PROT|nr:hypothetical protein ID47_09895 [Candidatus Paracaedibacter acanthamoebae]
MGSLTVNHILLSVVCGAALLSGCSGDYTPKEGQEAPIGRDDARKRGYGTLFGDDVLLFGATKKYDPSQGSASRVNHHLWQASLDVLSFMPLASSDAAGGVIVTDWYSTPEKPNERIKVTVKITDRVLRSDALHVTINKQIKKAGDWVAMTADPKIARDMEDLILTKARDLKVKAGK